MVQLADAVIRLQFRRTGRLVDAFSDDGIHDFLAASVENCEAIGRTRVCEN